MNIPGYCNFHPLYQRVAKLLPNNSHLVEVGSWLGHSAVYLAEQAQKQNKTFQFDCIDLWELGKWSDSDHYKVIEELVGHSVSEDYDFYHLFQKYTQKYSMITPRKGNSWELCKDYLPASLDFVMIDASHTYGSVMHDIACWWPKLKSTGLLAGDDYNWLEVKAAVDDFAKILGVNIITMGNAWIMPRDLNLSQWSKVLGEIEYERMV